MIKLGVNTASLQKKQDIKAYGIVDFIIKEEFKAVEFRDEYPFSENVSERDAELIRERLLENNIQCSVHLPFYDINLAAFREDVRQAGISVSKKSIYKSYLLGASTVTVHGGNMRTNYYSEKWLEHAYELSLDSLKELVNEASKYGIRVLLENLNLFKKNERVIHAYPEELLKTKEEMDNSIGFTLDIGHVVSTESDIVGFIHELGPENIFLAHLNDNHLVSDEHLAVGDGIIDYDSFIKAYIEEKWDFPLLFETISVDSVLKSRRHLIKLIEKYSFS